MRLAFRIAAIAMLTAVPAVAAAQETPTERSAAADVIRRMNDLERSLALPQLVARLTGRDARRDAVVLHAKQLMDKRSEEHTSELQSRLHLVCRLLLEKKKKREKISGARDHS